MESKYTAKVNHDIGLASLSDPLSGIRVATVPQEWGKKKSAELGYASARFSRSKNGIEEILSSMKEKEVDSNSRLEKIVHSYGHSSVMGLSSVTVFIENIPVWLAARIHYLLPPQYMSQEASTRYIDFSAPNMVCSTAHKPTVEKALKYYQELRQPTYDYLKLIFKIEGNNASEVSALNARTFDCLRYLLPGSLNTSISLSTDARVLSGLIAQLTDGDSLELILGELLYELMTGNKSLSELGYVPEIDGLIRHTEKSTKKYESDKLVLTRLQNADVKVLRALKIDDCIGQESSQDFSLVENYYMSLFPDLLLDTTSPTTEFLATEIGEILVAYHNRHRLIGNKAQTYGLNVQGRMDFGSLRDFNRHRSLNKVIPFLERVAHSPVYPEFTICPYLEPETRLYSIYHAALTDIYRELETAPYRLQRINAPLAHSVRYKFSGNLDAFQYTTELRSRCGGHIAYRQYAWDWFRGLEKTCYAINWFDDNLIPVEVFNKQQFIDRS